MVLALRKLTLLLHVSTNPRDLSEHEQSEGKELLLFTTPQNVDGEEDEGGAGEDELDDLQRHGLLELQLAPTDVGLKYRSCLFVKSLRRE